MKIRMLGTGFGECKVKKKSSKDFRRRGGVLIDETILIDVPEDIFDVAEDLGFSDLFDKVSDVIISHSHTSHFSAETLVKLAKNGGVRVYATGKVLDQRNRKNQAFHLASRANRRIYALLGSSKSLH